MLGLIIPLLVAVATQYSTQVIPDFDDYDCDGPDDGDWDEKNSQFAPTPLESHLHRGVTLDDPARTLASLSYRSSCRIRMERRRPQEIRRTHGHPDLSRGPPLPNDPDCEEDPASAGCGTRQSDDPDHGLGRAGSVDGSRQSPPQALQTGGIPERSRSRATPRRRTRVINQSAEASFNPIAQRNCGPIEERRSHLHDQRDDRTSLVSTSMKHLAKGGVRDEICQV
jgi:hypothetical protein